MNDFKFRPATEQDFFDNWPGDWPSKTHYANQHKVRLDQREEFQGLLAASAGERELERFLGRNPEVLALTTYMYMTGHHAAWIYPKAQIRAANDDIRGLIPDYILAGANSNGVSWFMLELKGADQKAFTKRGTRVYLSPVANQGICQLLNYIDVGSHSQAYLRDGMELTGFREPSGILMIGTEEESQDKHIRQFKAAWNRAHPRLQIRSYSALLRTVDGKLRDFNRWPPPPVP